MSRISGLRLELTRHAEEAISERGIELAWVEATVAEPDTTEPDATYPNAIRAFRSIEMRDGRVLRVVYVESAGYVRVITTFFDRARTRQLRKGSR